MIRTPLFIITLIAGIFCSGCTASKGPQLPEPKSSTPVSFAPPSLQEWKLQNGLTVFYLPDPELPTVRGTLSVYGGSFLEKEQERGAYAAVGSLMRLGGTAKYSPEELDRKLENLSASVSSSVGGEISSVSFSCLKTDLQEVFPLLSEVALRPRFDDRRTKLYQAQMREGIRRRTDDPDTIAGLTFSAALFGDSPYGRSITSQQIKALSQEKLKRIHKELFDPSHAILTITGDISRQEVEEFVQKEFAQWKGQGKALVFPEPGASKEPALYFVKAPFTQSTVFVGEQGIKRGSPHQYAIQVFNEIFGSGGMSSALMKRIRTELGLAYGTYGAIMPGVVKGKNVMVIQTKAPSTGVALFESFQVLSQARRVPYPEEVFDEQKEGVINSFVFSNESKDQTLARRVLFRFYGYPENYDATYVNNIREVSSEKVRDVAAELWHPEKLIVVVVGNEQALKAVQEEFSKLPESLQKGGIKEVQFDEVPQFS